MLSLFKRKWEVVGRCVLADGTRGDADGALETFRTQFGADRLAKRMNALPVIKVPLNDGEVVPLVVYETRRRKS